MKKLNDRLEEAVRNIDGRLEDLECNTENFPSFSQAGEAYKLFNLPVPAVYHLSTDRPIRTGNRHNDVNYHNSSPFHNANKLLQKIARFLVML